MRRLLPGVLVGAVLGWCPPGVDAQDVEELFRKINPSVVVIKAKGRDVSLTRGVVRFNEIGSGVLVSADGRVVTAAHVAHAMDEIRVEFLGGETGAARVVASEPEADLSMLQLARVPAGARPARLGDSDHVKVGQQVLVIGAPYGLSHSFSAGWISARWPPNTAYRTMPLAEFFQTTATINTGNSGGPMFNMAGEVIGIVSHIISKSGGFDGLGFVVTANLARRLLLDQNPFWSGVESFMLSGDLARVFNLPQGAGMLVQRVAANSPAAQLGLKPGTMTAVIEGDPMIVGGDVILEVQGVPVTADGASYLVIRDRLIALRPGDAITVVVWRNGRKEELTAKRP
jgi:S1-C subfamily serine protease